MELDFLYMPSADVARDAAYWVNVLDARLVFAVEGMGARVAMLELSSRGPRILLTDHLDDQRTVLIYRVEDLERTHKELRSKGWKSGRSIDIPHGPCTSFATPGGQRVAIYQLTRPEVAKHFEGSDRFRYRTPRISEPRQEAQVTRERRRGTVEIRPDGSAHMGTESMFRRAGFRRIRGVVPGLPRYSTPRVTMRATLGTKPRTASAITDALARGGLTTVRTPVLLNTDSSPNGTRRTMPGSHKHRYPRTETVRKTRRAVGSKFRTMRSFVA